MQFTKLRLAGFKSFVEPVEFAIEPGVTGIVGPNGCGKSNLVEAIKWVMGETSAKQIRGNEMDDVIFSGTSNRPGRNIAEVGLEMENTERTAPAQFNDFTDIEVTRRIVREKGSTYRVNSKEVRARDVHLLFADQASGARSTALVSQGQISEIVLAKPTDRRKLLEEAAGITGLHSRRHEAELRLRGAETNLDRLDDILVALDTQMQSLRKQVRQATRYRNLNDHIRKAQAAYFIIRWDAASGELETAISLLKESERAVAEMTGHLSAATTKQVEAASCLPQQRQEEAEAAAALQRLMLERDSLGEEEKRIDAERQETETRLSQTSQDMEREHNLISDCTAAIVRLENEHENYSRESDDQNEVMEKASLTLKAAQGSFETLNGETASAIKKLAEDETRRENLIRRRSEVDARLTRLGDEKEILGHQIQVQKENITENNTLSDSTTNLEYVEAKMQESRKALVTAESRRLEAMKRLNILQNDAQKTLSAAAELTAKEKALSELLETGDPDLWPPLIDSLNVESGYEAALGVALGDDLSAPTDEASPVHWTSLPDFEDITPLPMGVTPLSDYVSGSVALNRRLSQIGVIKDSNTGQKFASQLKQGQRIVSLDGGFWRWDGYTATSDAPAVATVRLEQRNSLKDIRQELVAARSKAVSVEDRLEAARIDVDLATKEESGTRRAALNAEQIFFDVQKSHGELHKKISEINANLSIQQEAMVRVVSDLDEAGSILATTISEIASLPDTAIIGKEVETLKSQENYARTELTEAQSAHHNLQHQKLERRDRMQNLADELAAWKERQKSAASQMEQLEERQRSLLAARERFSAQPDKICSRRNDLLEKIEVAEEVRRKTADHLIVSEEKLTEADNDLKLAGTRLAHIREERVRAEAMADQNKQTMEALVERIEDQLNCSHEDLNEIAAMKNNTTMPELEVAEKRVERLERERETMGPVNLLAEAESQELREKIETLNKEREDLIKAIDKLRRGINELNREGRQRLMSSFTEVDKHFGELFTRLFGGGRAHLELTESDDPLEAGVEIMASPPGKKLQVLSLLSGGEQALTALALLFGVFLTNPAPICVLDEVDASLDDTNVDHFCTLVEEISHSLSTRFIVVTHHRMTMARMDRLYGVTMGERGVSQIVSVDLGQAVELREIA